MSQPDPLFQPVQRGRGALGKLAAGQRLYAASLRLSLDEHDWLEDEAIILDENIQNVIRLALRRYYLGRKRDGYAGPQTNDDEELPNESTSQRD